MPTDQPHIPKPVLISEDDTRAFLGHIIDPAVGCAEIRILEADVHPKNGWVVAESRFPKTVVGYFDEVDSAIAELRKVRGVSPYVTLNPIDPALKARAYNRLKLTGKVGAASDKDVVCLRWLFLDIDPRRPTGISSTDNELAAAVAVRDRILDDHPVMSASALWGRSGNGCWILVRLPDYPPDADHAAVVERAVACFAERYSDEWVSIDVATKNPSRIMCLPGCLKAKGDSIPERPHRPATIESRGEVIA